MSSSLPPSSVQEGANNVAFNSVMIASLLMGIYTVVYLGTLYIYASKKTVKNWFIISSISLAYLTYAIPTGAQWYQAKMAFVNKGTSRESVFLALWTSTAWDTYLDNICLFLACILADGLLIWRCFHVWDRSFRAVSIPLFLLFCQIGINLSVLVIVPAVNFNPSPSQINILDILNATTTFETCFTSAVTTVLIAYKIHSVSKLNVLQGPKSRLNDVIEILVQSAAAYSVAALLDAVSGVIPISSDFVNVVALEDYSGVFFPFVAGLAPTIMVARVALAPDRATTISTITHISGLQFQSATANATQSGRESVQPEIRDSHFIQEPKESEVKQGGIVHIV